VSSIPLPALDIKPQAAQDPMADYARLVQLRGLVAQQQQEAQMRPLQLQQAQAQAQETQMDLASQKAFTRAYTEAQGDPDQTLALAAKYGASPKAILPMHNMFLDQKAKTLDLVLKQGDLAKQHADLAQGAHDEVTNAAPQDRPQVYQQQLQALQQRGVDVSQMPPQYPGDDAFKFLGAVVKSHSQQVDEAFKTAETFKNNQQGFEAQQGAQQKQTQNAALQGTGLVPGMAADQQGLLSYMRSVPGARPENYAAWKAQQEAVATAPQKIAVAQAEGQARANVDAQVARGSNAALAQVPPHLVAPASAAAAKAGEDYAQAQSVSQRLQAMMDAARSGNVVSYQLIPQEGALQVTTSQGVHRINMAEIQNYGGGSLWQRMQGHLGKQLTGASIPSSVLDDMAAMQQIQAQGSQVKYNNTIKTVNDTYGSSFKPVQMDALPQNQKPPTAASGTAGYTRIQASDGSIHDIPSGNMDKAKQRDPGLKVIQ